MGSFSTLYEETRVACSCGNDHYPLATQTFFIEGGAIQKLPLYLNEHLFGRVVIVVDDNTYAAAGETLVALLEEAGIQVDLSIVPPNEQGDVVADEQALVHVQVDVPPEADALLAVGAGTIHDMTRFVSYKMNKPFISVPTAPSVDGFTSMGAPIVVRQRKVTYQTIAPVALFADIDLLRQAPQSMVAAGFGDMLGKYTSLADWKFEHFIQGEAFCEGAANLTERALHTCVTHVDEIASGSKEGIQILIEGLIQSGMAMSLFGRSHPASGAEHHLSHYWEMEYIKQNRKQLLHGEKVGVSTCLMASHYHQKVLPELEQRDLPNKAAILNIIQSIPTYDVLQGYLQRVGGKGTLSELGIDKALFEESLQEAHHIRDRVTMLYYANENLTNKV